MSLHKNNAKKENLIVDLQKKKKTPSLKSIHKEYMEEKKILILAR